jgi:hypothetical protein
MRLEIERSVAWQSLMYVIMQPENEMDILDVFTEAAYKTFEKLVIRTLYGNINAARNSA